MRKSCFCFIGSFVGILVLAWLVQVQTNTGKYMGELAAWVMMVSLVFLLPAGFVFRYKEKRKAYEALPPEEQARIEAENERKLEEAQEKLRQLKADSTIVSTAIVNSTTIGKQKSSATSAIARGVVGGALFGPVGAIAGAVTPKKTLTTETKDVTFSVRYASSRCELETVKFGSRRYNELARYIA